MSTMYYKSTGSLEQLKADLIAAHKDWTEEYDKFTATVGKMTTEWTGEASETFKDSYDTKEKTAMNDVDRVFNAIEVAVETVKERISTAEETNKTRARR